MSMPKTQTVVRKVLPVQFQPIAQRALSLLPQEPNVVKRLEWIGSFIKPEALIPVTWALQRQGLITEEAAERVSLSRAHTQISARGLLHEASEFSREVGAAFGLRRGNISTMTREMILAAELGGATLPALYVNEPDERTGALAEDEFSKGTLIVDVIWWRQAMRGGRAAEAEHSVLRGMGYHALSHDWAPQIQGRTLQPWMDTALSGRLGALSGQARTDLESGLQARRGRSATVADTFALHAALELGLDDTTQLCRRHFAHGLNLEEAEAGDPGASAPAPADLADLADLVPDPQGSRPRKGVVAISRNAGKLHFEHHFQPQLHAALAAQEMLALDRRGPGAPRGVNPED